MEYSYIVVNAMRHYFIVAASEPATMTVVAGLERRVISMLIDLF